MRVQLFFMELNNYKPEDFLQSESFMRYCRGENGHDIAFWENWIENHPEKKEDVLLAKELFYKLHLTLSPQEKEAELQKLQSMITVYSDEEEMPVKIKRWQKRSFWQNAAAVAVAAVFLGFVFRNVFPEAAFSKNNISKTAESAVQNWYALSGERKNIILPDSTEVILNSNSAITLAGDFNVKERNIQLTGEAFFHVAKNAEQPFIVHTGNISVQAIGTSFKVSAYDFKPVNEVKLVEGKVKVSQFRLDHSLATMTLDPGEAFVFNKVTQYSNKENFDVISEMNWRDGTLSFHDADLQQAVAQIENWYGVQVKLMLKTNHEIHFNGEFNNKNLMSVLSAFAYVNKMEFEVSGNRVILRESK